jgi:REP element-mobilizing transposase RayT
MPWALVRFQQPGTLHFITFSYYRRLPFFDTPRAEETFENSLHQTRRSYRFHVIGYVVMPEHVHLAGGPPRELIDKNKLTREGAPSRRVAHPVKLIPRRNLHEGAPFRLLLAGWGFLFVRRRHSGKKSPPGQNQPGWGTHINRHHFNGNHLARRHVSRVTDPPLQNI